MTRPIVDTHGMLRFLPKELTRDPAHGGGYIDADAWIGRPPEDRTRRSSPDKWFEVVVDPGAVIEAGVSIDAGTIRPTCIGKCFLMKKAHVGHDSVVHDACEMAPLSIIGGHVVLEPGVRLGLGAIVIPRMTVGEGARIGAGAVVTKDVPAGEIWVGVPAKKIGMA